MTNTNPVGSTAATPKVASVGVIFGKFFPLHKGHLSVFDFARTQVDKLYIFCCTDESRDYKLFCDSSLICAFDREERTNAVRFAMMQYDNVEVHNLREDNIPSYPNGWQEWANVVKQHFATLEYQPTVVFTSEPQDAQPYKQYLDLDAHLVDPDRKFITTSGTECRRKSFTNFDFVSGFLQSRLSLYVKLNYQDLLSLASEEELSLRLASFARNYNLAYMPKVGYKEHKHLVLSKVALAPDNASLDRLIEALASLSYGNLLQAVAPEDSVAPYQGDDFKRASYEYQARQHRSQYRSGSAQKEATVRDLQHTFHKSRILPLTIDLVRDTQSAESKALATAGETNYQETIAKVKACHCAEPASDRDPGALPLVNSKFPGYLQLEIKNLADLEITLLKALNSIIDLLEVDTVQ